ncbi:MAG: aminotransferase class V-fold PLP-dependent enzyme [Planctomycetes bacterium]|nr:aminotransferase class V-fold PLP-dependent enzyme [Planctomycetota bacterium]
MDSTPSGQSIRSQWTIPDEVTYLNHGSFGPSPQVVQEERQRWYRKLEAQPMDFYLRELEDAWDAALSELAAFVGARPQDIVFVENATTGMNIVAQSVPLEPGDEVLLSDHEYGAVKRIWETTCAEKGAKVVYGCWPLAPRSPRELVDGLMERASRRTRLIVVSHVTSPTAMVVPVEAICAEARQRDIPVCVDGPHAIAMLPVDLGRIGCAFYTASCHKWLCAPFGSGFLYVDESYRDGLRPAVRSWGLSLSGRPSRWQDEFLWVGTRDPSAFLAVPAAIRFLRQYGPERFRERTHALARFARQQIVERIGDHGLVPDSPEWYASMVSLPLPPSDITPRSGLRDPLQESLWSEYGIEVPVLTFRDRRILRVSCHLYNDRQDIDRLVTALDRLADT